MKRETGQKKIEETQKPSVRATASQVVGEVLSSGKKLKECVDRKAKYFEDERDRALLKEICYGVLRNLPLIDFSIDLFLKNEIKDFDKVGLSIMRVGSYQILFLDRIPVYAVVNECVNATKILKKEPLTGVVNTILRKIALNKEEILQIPYKKPYEESLSDKYGMPLWLVKRYLKRFGDFESEKILDSFNKESETSIVFFKIEDYLNSKQILEREKFQLEENDLFELTYFVKGKDITESEAFKKGAFYVCDPASQLPAKSLPLKENSFSLDPCAAPGTKTIIISKNLKKNSFLVSSDFSKWRVKRLIENKIRYDLDNVFIVYGDILNSLPFKDKFYSILLDAPCTSLGTLKKNPEIRWQIDEERIKKESKRQLEMIFNVSKCVEKGGFLLYSVCSIEKEETLDVVENFLKENKDFEKAKLEIDEKFKTNFTLIDKGTLMVKPYQHKGDAFFISLLRRKVGKKD